MNKANLASYLGSSVLLGVIVLIAANTGASDISLLNWSRQSDHLQLIFLEIRLPRILVAGICGASLAVAGVLSQGLFRNPLASPTILGTTSGANVFVVALIFLGTAQDHWIIQPVAAFLGAILTTTLVLKLSQSHRFSSTARLLLVGYALNALFGAGTTFLLSLSLREYGTSQNIIYWLLGGCNGKGWHHVAMGLPWFLAGLAIALKVSAQLDILNLGERVASTLAVSVDRLKITSIISIAVLVASSVAICGGIGFIGLIIPHLTRLYMGARHRPLTICSAINGASLLIGADTLARVLLAPDELQVGALISLLGAPVFIGLLVWRQEKQWV